ncbi:nuclear transport factor 2 family protein [Streptomyces sp. NPDC096310]|uniref:nuclear transport factor 2 family protein n=1 Tax=Streptomyces sp. NPDC096310 TaxID=3366082 RepID=UPI003813708D
MSIPEAQDFAFDPILMVKRVRERYDSLRNPRHKQMLGQVLEHLEGEVEFNLDRLMDAYPVPQPQYRVWHNGADIGPKGREAVREWYAGHLLARGLVLQYDIETIVVDDETVVTDGYMSAVLPGQNIRDRGVPEADPSRIYLKRYRNCILWPFNEAGELIGEEFHLSGNRGDSDLWVLDDADVPQEFHQLTEAAEAFERGTPQL